MATTAAQLYHSVAATRRRRASSQPSSRVSATAAGRSYHGLLVANPTTILLASKQPTTACTNVNSMSNPIDPSSVTYTDEQVYNPADELDSTVEPTYTEDQVSDPADELDSTVEPAVETEMARNNGVAPARKKYAILHEFCLGIPFGGILFSMGLIGFLLWRSPISLIYGVAPGIAILALGMLSLKIWKSGKSNLPFILAQAAVAAAVAWKHFEAYNLTKKVLPWGFYSLLSATMFCFYTYVMLAGGNPPPKKKAAAALS